MSTDTATQSRVETGSLSTLHLVGVALAAVSGVLHLYLAALFVPSPMGLSFAVAGVGFLAGCAAVVANYRRALVYLLGIPFTLGQVVVWYVVNAPDFSALGYVDKAAQVGLVAVLVVLYRRES
ncbi:hypothetical protein C471_03408 [Halorubrum saccharovorum DSM 1137]|uniref:Integral membrane protein n=1 Tax=Halorubrum saccharovorum DSM 1137 TaxID=1227484 RepID=M0E5Z8_9EURY|nr:hypothetical protein [Halorubrum saccharovorum]ELZ42473.1 hypothetical protein C471_03408 [Halorubrum saccharovorum DSM 1137]